MNRTALFLCSAVAVAALPAAASGQWSDNFDAYNTTVPLPQQSTWEPWYNDPAAGNYFATDARSRSAPNSCIVDGPDDAVHQYSGYTSGVWAYTAWQFIPNEAASGSTYFILLNTYDVSGVNTNWSTQIAMDPVLDTVSSEFEGNSVPLIQGSWVEIRVIIDLDLDQESIYYDGAHVSTKQWTEGVSGGGALNIAAVDLWANNIVGWATYYDDMSITAVDPFGACCFLDGSCEDNMSPTACTTDPRIGTYQGHGSLCANIDCPAFGPCGWIYEAPFFVADTTCGAGNDCPTKPSEDQTYEVIINYQSDWTFSICDVGGTWDSFLYVSNTDCCGTEWQNDDAPGCSLGSEITIPDLPPGTYYVAIEGTSQSQCGAFTLIVSSPCEAPCDPAGIPEPEPICQDNVPDTTNVGCNGDPGQQVFTPIACGDIYCGTSGNFLNVGVETRDMDWYELEFTETTIVHWIGIGEFDVRMWIADITNGCVDPLPIITSQDGGPCETVDIARVLEPGIYSFIISTQEFTGWDCGVEYEARLTCEPVSPPCPEDLNGDGVVNVLDLLIVLADWGLSGVPADINGDGIVNVLDLLLVLGAWGPC